MERFQVSTWMVSKEILPRLNLENLLTKTRLKRLCASKIQWMPYLVYDTLGRGRDHLAYIVVRNSRCTRSLSRKSIFSRHCSVPMCFIWGIYVTRECHESINSCQENKNVAHLFRCNWAAITSAKITAMRFLVWNFLVWNFWFEIFWFEIFGLKFSWILVYLSMSYKMSKNSQSL